MTTPKHPEHTEALLLRDAMIAGLAGAASELSEVGKELYRASVLTKVQRTVLFTIMGMMLASLVGLIIVAEQNVHNGKVIRACTEPTGDCYKRNNEQTTKVITQLIRQNEASAYCSPRSPSALAYKACIAGYVKGAAAVPTK